MSQPASVECQIYRNVPVFLPPTYFDEKIGAILGQMMGEQFQKGHTRFVVDLQKCKIINSRGLSSLLDLAIKCLDDYRGRLGLVNTDPTKENLFGLVGLSTLIVSAPNLDEAVNLVTKA